MEESLFFSLWRFIFLFFVVKLFFYLSLFLEGWQSGLLRLADNQVVSSGTREFESPPLKQHNTIINSRYLFRVSAILISKRIITNDEKD